MKTLFLGAIAIAGFMLCPARADLVIYKGTARINYIGQSHNLHISFKLFLVVDQNTADVGEILYTSAGGQKQYSTNTESNLHIVQVSGSGGKVYTAISRPPSDCETNSTTEGVLLEGVTVILKIGTNTSVYFPKTVTSTERSYDSAAPANLSDGILAASFDSKDTLISNSAGEDIDQAMTRLVTALQSQGYGEASLAARSRGGSLTRQAASFLPAAQLSP